MYAYLHKRLSKSEMNDICMWLYDDTRWSVQNKSFTIWQNYGKYTAYMTFFCFVLTGIICYAWQCFPFQEKYVANSYKGKVFTKHHRGWEKHIAFRLKEGIKKSFFTFARLSFLVKKPRSEQAFTESWRELIKVYKKCFNSAKETQSVNY